MNELRDLMHDAVAAPPPEADDLTAVVGAGRRRVRRRRAAAVSGTALAVAAVVTVGTLAWPEPTATDPAPAPANPTVTSVPVPDGLVLSLSEAPAAVEGEDYRVLTQYTNEDLDRDNGDYFDGVTDDGLVLFRDAPDTEDPSSRLALKDPATGNKEWLPPAPVDTRVDLWPVALEAERLVFTTYSYGEGGMPGDGTLVAVVHDRRTGEWRQLEWPGLPAVEGPVGQLGPDGRLYVKILSSAGKPPVGGWPTGPDGEADDADAEGDTYRLWSVSLTDPDDVRDEQLEVGGLAFTDSHLVWTDATNGAGGSVHVRDLATGEEHSFDPGSGERCNQLSFGATDRHVVLGQYCGTYAEGGRDDRVQILTLDGEQVLTIQDDGMDGGLASTAGDGLVRATSYARGTAGTYVFDLGTMRFLRLAEGHSMYAGGGSGPTAAGTLLFSTPVNRGKGATQWLVEMTD